MSKKIKIIFTLSFLLNIVVIGILLGGLYKAKNGHHFSAVHQNTQEVMQKNMRHNRMEMRRDFNKIKGYKKELKNIIGAEEFDREAFEYKINQIFEVKNAVSGRKAVILGQTLSELPQEERQALSSHVLGRLLARPSKGHKDRNYMNRKEK